MASPSIAPAPHASAVTLVTQTRVRADAARDFAGWQQHVNDVIARFPGFIDHEVIEPSPIQPDWVIVQRFASIDAARAWLGSPDRLRLIEQAQPWLVGQDDIHVIQGAGTDGAESPASAVISTRVVPGKEDAFQAWQRRIAVAQARFPGFQGYKLEPPVPGVQDDWVVIIRFDSEPHLQAWMDSPERRQLVDESAAFTAGTHARVVRTGFDAWFKLTGGDAPPPAWKQNMLVLLALYPVVFLFGFFVQTPLLQGRAGLPFWLALFIGNVAGVVLLNWLVPWVGGRFAWWLNPPKSDPDRINWAGAGLIVVLYCLWLLAFSRFP